MIGYDALCYDWKSSGVALMTDAPTVHVIDDDESVRHSLAFLLESAGHSVQIHESAGAFLDIIDFLQRGCVLTDVHMPGMDGLTLQQRLIEMKTSLPVIIMTGHADLPVAIRALQAGAVDLIEKPFTDEQLLAAVRRALQFSRHRQTQDTEAAKLATRLATLTPPEAEVLSGLVAGNSMTSIASDLGTSPERIEIYRASLMEKMGAESLTELIQIGFRAALVG